MAGHSCLQLPKMVIDFNFRYMLGTFHGTTHFQLLSGIYIGRQKEYYLPIFIILMCIISAIAFFCVSYKRSKEKYNDKIFLQHINILIQTPSTVQHQYNNEKNNVLLFNGYEITMTVGIVFSICLLVLSYFFASKDDINHYWANYIYIELAAFIIFKVIIPIIYLVKRKDVRNFIRNNYF